MTRRTSCTKTSVVTAAVLLVGSASLSAASAMPAGEVAAAAGGAPLLTQVMVGEHMKYPDANSAAAKARRAKRNAPNYMCDKRPALCQ